MNPEHWQKVCRFFASAFRRNPAARETVFKQDCAGDPTLRASVDQLQAEHAQAVEETTIEDRKTNADDSTIGHEKRADETSTIRDEHSPVLGPTTSSAVHAAHPDASPLFTPAGLRRAIKHELKDRDCHLTCPQCHQQFRLIEPPAGAEVVCSSCGYSFPVDAGSTSPRTTQWRDGRYAGRFELIATVGTGGFGTVYKALDPQLDRIVALKVLRLGDLASDDHKDRFLREARNAAQLRHPAIVQVHEIGDEAGVPFIVSDYIEGVTLSDWLTGRRPPFRESAAAGRRACQCPGLRTQ